MDQLILQLLTSGAIPRDTLPKYETECADGSSRNIADRRGHRPREWLDVADGQREAALSNGRQLISDDGGIGNRLAGEPLQIAPQVVINESLILKGEQHLALRSAMEGEVIAVMSLCDVLARRLRRIHDHRLEPDSFDDLYHHTF